MYCTNCGKEFEGKFCPECGTPVQDNTDYSISFPNQETAQTSQRDVVDKRKQEKGKKKKKPLGCLIVVIIILLLIMAVGGGDNEDHDSSVTGSSSETQNRAETPESSNAYQDSSTANSESLKTMDFSTVLSIVDIAAQSSYGDNHTVSGDETGIILSVWAEDISMAAAMVMVGDEKLKDEWAGMVDNMAQMCKDIQGSVSELGYPNVGVMVNLLNDQDHDKILLSIIGGAVVYDCTKQ